MVRGMQLQCSNDGGSALIEMIGTHTHSLLTVCHITHVCDFLVTC